MTDRLRDLLAKATPGPWRIEGHGMVWAGEDYWVTVNLTEADTALIVALVNAAPLLLDVIEAAREIADDWWDSPSNLKLNAALTALDALPEGWHLSNTPPGELDAALDDDPGMHGEEMDGFNMTERNPDGTVAEG